MQMVEHILTLRGPSVVAGRPCPDAVGRVLQLVEPAVRESISMGFRNTSALPGRRPEWFRRASDIRFVDVSAGEDETTLLHFEAPRFGEAAEELYRQKQLFEGIRPGQSDTGFDLLGDVLADIRSGAADSLRFDVRLLRHVGRFRAYPTKQGVHSVAISGDRYDPCAPAVLDQAVSDRADALCRQTPPPRRARIAGTLDMIRDHDNVFELILEGGKRARGLWAESDMASLSDHFGQDVLVEGTAVFRASGNLLRIEADAVGRATEADRHFRAIPRAMFAESQPQAVLRPQDAHSGAAALYGKWPGTESEEEILAALRDMD